MEVGQVISGYQSEFGVTLNHITAIEGDTVVLESKLYAPDHPDFANALIVVESLNQDFEV